MRIAIVSGVVVNHDAISAAVASQARLLESLPGVESVVVFAQHFDRPLSCDSCLAHESWGLINNPAFARCDIAIFHWGIHYDLFDALTLLAAGHGPTPVIHFHNCTPAELVDPSQRAMIEHSLAKFQHAISLSIPMWTYSEFNRLTLIEWGVAPEHIAFVPFPIDAPAHALTHARATQRSERFELLTVGRLVPAKGVHVLIEAIGQLDAPTQQSLHLRIAGSHLFSHTEYVDQLHARVGELGLDDVVEFVEGPTDDDLWDLYASSSMVVSPSLHEGLCMPIIEGYAFGTPALGTTAGNLPYLIVPPDEVVAADDPAALAAALQRAVQSWVAGSEYSVADATARRAVAAQYSSSSAGAALHHALADLLVQSRRTD